MNGTHLLARTFGLLTRALLGVSMASLVVLMLFVFLAVVARYALNRPIAGDYELSMLLLIVVVAPVFAAVQQKGMNIRVDFFYQRFPAGVRLAIDLFSDLAMAAACGMACWGLVGLFRRTLASAPSTEGLGVPIAPFILVLCVGVGVAALQFLATGLARWRGQGEAAAPAGMLVE